MSDSEWGNLNPKISYAKPKDVEGDPRKRHYSDYFFTLSSNVPARNKSPEEIDSIHLALQDLLICATKGENLRYIFDNKSYKKEDEGKPISPAIFAGMPRPELSNIAFEVGEKKRGKRIHIHAIFKTTHTGFISLNKSKMRDVMNACWKQINDERTDKLPNFYFHSKWIPSSKPLEEYASKMAHMYKGKALTVPARDANYWKSYTHAKGNNDFPLDK